MRINWKIRIRSVKFWIQVLLSVVTPMLAYYELTGADMTSWPMVFDTVKNAFSNPYVVVTMGVSVFNAVIDPTTAGLCDSSQAMSYTEIKKETDETNSSS
ncbi:MAG TPA: phage holin [Candidatus Scatomonas merdavium]|nr:phage holin [Candidatus Scatomonas merdavium]